MATFKDLLRKASDDTTVREGIVKARIVAESAKNDATKAAEELRLLHSRDTYERVNPGKYLNAIKEACGKGTVLHEKGFIDTSETIIELPLPPNTPVFARTRFFSNIKISIDRDDNPYGQPLVHIYAGMQESSGARRGVDLSKKYEWSTDLNPGSPSFQRDFEEAIANAWEHRATEEIKVPYQECYW